MANYITIDFKKYVRSKLIMKGYNGKTISKILTDVATSADRHVERILIRLDVI